MAAERTLVYGDWLGLQSPKLIGTLFFRLSMGIEVFSFEYDSEWLKRSSLLLDPALKFFSGKQYPPKGRTNFGLFLDSAPDRWGRLLMNRREEINARKEKRPKRPLFSIDYLLGVHDEPRIGGIRFKTDENGPFLSNEESLTSPPVARLRELEQASLAVEGELSDDPEYEKWLRMLIAPGGTLGGARPKASVKYPDDSLWIAKFPSANDDIDFGAWEFVVHQLAENAGVYTSKAELKQFSEKYHTFLVKRFDRTRNNERIHFVSAMTMLERQDGDDASKGASYIELAEFLIQFGAKTDADLEQLWRRIVFNICVSNSDDHLRNHGFLLTEKGWELSPAFDMNPSESARGLKLNISESDNSLDLDLAREVAPIFRVSKKDAEEIIGEVRKAVKAWKNLAKQLGISSSELERMGNAFRMKPA